MALIHLLCLAIIGFELNHVHGQLPKMSYPHGIFEGIPISTFMESVEHGGWGFTRCWEVAYSTAMTGRVGDVIESNPACPTDYDEKPYWLMFGGCYSGDDEFCTDIIYNGAVTTYDILDLETEGNTPVEDQPGVWWYHRESYSFGYSGTSTIQLGSCDVKCRDVNDECARYKLCWHLRNYGGFRVGNMTDLNDATDWNKIIYFKPVEGLLTGVHRTYLADMNYVECFYEAYNVPTSIDDIVSGRDGRCPSMIASPDEEWSLIIGAIDESGDSSYLAYGAMVSSRILFDFTHENDIDSYNGIHFYHREDDVFGYTSMCGSPHCVDLSNGCDSITGIGERICWYVDGVTPGYRAGDHLDLGGSSTWKRFVAFLNPFNESFVFPTYGPSGSPTNMPTYGPSRSPSVSPTMSPSMHPSESPTLSPPECAPGCTRPYCQSFLADWDPNEPINNQSTCSAMDMNVANLVDPFDCAAEEDCGHVPCEDCGTQQKCVRQCKAWLESHRLRRCQRFQGTWCARQCNQVKRRFKCWNDCDQPVECPE